MTRRTVLVLLQLLVTTCELSPTFAVAQGRSCDDLLLAPVARIHHWCRVIWRHYRVVCRKSSEKFDFDITMEFNIEDKETLVLNSSHFGLCLSLNKHRWTNKGREVVMKFSNMIIGAALVPTNCIRDHPLGDIIYNGTTIVLPRVDHRSLPNRGLGNKPILPRYVDCQYSYILRAEIAELPTMKFRPDDASFWNFSSPLYGTHYNWFLEFSLMEWSKLQQALTALQGTSVTIVKIEFKSRKRHYELQDLKNMTSLYYLKMVLISSRVKDFYKGTPNLKILALIKAGLKIIPPSVSKIKNLEILTLTHNEIKTFTTEIMHLKNLRILSLDWNKLGDLQPFPELPNLSIITLSFCGLNGLRAHAFRGLSNITKLYLQGNPFIYLDPLSFAGLPKLTVVTMERCSLTTWPIEAFRGLHLDHLSLRENALVTMEDLGAQAISLKTLDVSYNHIRSWDNPQLFSCRNMDDQVHQEDSAHKNHNITVKANSVCFNGSWVLKLNLANNTISEITYPMRESLDVVQQVLMGGNPLHCDACSVPEAQRWLARTRANVSRPLACVRPALVRGTPLRLLQFDARPCSEAQRWWLGAVGGSLLVVSAVCALVGAAIFQLRAEIAYLAYLVRVRRGDSRTAAAAAAAARARGGLRYDAFVCYSARNRKWVSRRLAPLLERRPGNYSLCLFERDFRMGTHIVANIADAIDQSRKVLVVLSRHFIQSQWCQWELELAQHKLFSEDRACLVLLELEPLVRGRLPRLLRFLLDTRPVVRWPRPETATAVKAAAAELRRALGPSLCPPPPRPSSEHLGQGGAFTETQRPEEFELQDVKGRGMDELPVCSQHLQRALGPSLFPPPTRPSNEHLGQREGQGGAFTETQRPEEFELQDVKGRGMEELPVYSQHLQRAMGPSLLPLSPRPSNEHLGRRDDQGGAFIETQRPEEFKLQDVKGRGMEELPV